VNPVPAGWTRVSDGPARDLVLAVDFDVTGRREATFRDLARLLPADIDLWQTASPPRRSSAQHGAEEYLTWWQELPRPGGASVRAVLGYCAGSMFAAALADHIQARHGRRPAVVLFNPGEPSAETVSRDVSDMIMSMAGLDERQRAALLRGAEEVRTSRRADFTLLSKDFAALYRDACAAALRRFDIDPAEGEELPQLFESYLDYLVAARQVPRTAAWNSALALNSRDHHGARFTGTELTFDTGRAELLRTPDVAAATAHNILAAQS
jgi:dienelactone hydrolase